MSYTRISVSWSRIIRNRSYLDGLLRLAGLLGSLLFGTLVRRHRCRKLKHLEPGTLEARKMSGGNVLQLKLYIKSAYRLCMFCHKCLELRMTGLVLNSLICPEYREEFSIRTFQAICRIGISESCSAELNVASPIKL